MFSIIPSRCRAVTRSAKNRQGLDVPPDAAGESDPAWRGDAFSKGVYIANKARRYASARSPTSSHVAKWRRCIRYIAAASR